MNPFRRSRALEKQLGLDAVDVDVYVPASAKSPELQRFTPVNIDEVDEADQDIEFLTSLSAQIERGELDVGKPLDELTSRLRADSPPAKPRRPEDDLEMFRAFAHEMAPETILSHVRVPDVELIELLDELHTMRAALRQKRAA